MGIALVQVTDSGAPASGLTSGCTFSSNNTHGNCIVLYTVGQSGAYPAISDSNSNVYHNAVDDGGDFEVNIWYAYNIGGGANTISLTWGATTPNKFVIAAEFSGVLNTADPLDKVVSTVNTNGPGTFSSASMNTTTDGQLIFGGMNCNGQWTALGAGFSFIDALLPATPPSQIETEYLIQATHGSIALSGTTNGGTWGLLGATFKAAPTGFQPPGQIISAGGW